MTEQKSATERGLPLAGAVALVSGAGGPMGAAIAARLAADGAALGLIDISGRRLTAVADGIKERHPGIRLHAVRANAVDGDETNAAIKEIVENLGAVTTLVNVVTGLFCRTISLAIASISASSASLTGFGCEKSKRSRSGATSEPFWATWLPSTWRKAS